MVVGVSPAFKGEFGYTQVHNQVLTITKARKVAEATTKRGYLYALIFREFERVDKLEGDARACPPRR
jgi:hypothetical protein